MTTDATATVCVFCGSKPSRSPTFTDTARQLGRAIASAGYAIVYGAGGAGMMGAVSDGALSAGGHVTGIIPQALMDREFGRTDLPDLRVVKTMHERKALMYELSDVFVTLPGGLGTLEEFFETTTWSQLELHDKPSLLLNIDGFYSPLAFLLDGALEAGFLTQRDRNLVTIVDSIDAVLLSLDQHLSR